MKKPTISDVAKLAGCSVGTVSAVINGKDTVRRETRQKVHIAINQLNFRPTSSAKNLKSGIVGRSVGIIIRDLVSPFYSEIAMGAKEYASEKGYSLFIMTSESSHEKEIEAIDNLLEKGVQGSIISPVITEKAEIDHFFYLKSINFPFVLMANVSGLQANVVSIDGFSATRKVVQHLVESGYERIVYFAGLYPSAHTRERREGFRRGIGESPLVLSDDMIFPAGNTFKEGLAKGLEFFRNRKNMEFPLAVVCYNDLVALGLHSALTQLGIMVPEEVAIVGYDDIVFAKHCPTPLTTVKTPRVELGRKAAEILIKSIESGQPSSFETILLPTEMVFRESTRKIKA
jgi:LacI family transcriptional regulator/LacI family repressor for deo operon, udp, cdd, tsx, nupC, and nupG